MAKIGERVQLKILREIPSGLYLDGGELGEVLLPHREVPHGNVIGAMLEVFLYTDSEDRPVATMQAPKAMPGQLAKLKCIDVNDFGAFLDWGMPKDLLVPFREQRTRMTPGHSYLVYLYVDEVSGRIAASSRISRFLDRDPHSYRSGDEVSLTVISRTPLGYQVAIDGTHSGLVFEDRVFQPLQPGEVLSGWIARVRDDGKLDLALQPPGRARVDSLEETILAELQARGGFWAVGDRSSAAEIHAELGISKRAFKQALGALFKKRLILIEERGIRLSP